MYSCRVYHITSNNQMSTTWLLMFWCHGPPDIGQAATVQGHDPEVGAWAFRLTGKNMEQIDTWLVVSTPLKNISQLGWFFPIYGKITAVFQTTNQIQIDNSSYHCYWPLWKSELIPLYLLAVVFCAPFSEDWETVYWKPGSFQHKYTLQL